MINSQILVGFQWDAGNARKSEDKHGISQAEAEEIFFNQPLLIASDEKHSLMETRLLALGATNANILLSVIFTLRDQGTLLRVISARVMSRKERIHYEKNR